MRRAAGVALAALVLAGCTPADPAPASDWATDASAHALALPQVAGPYAGTARLGDSVRPPTNSWVSGPTFGTDLPAYTGILAVTPHADGFAVGLPRIETHPSTVYGLAPDDLVVTVPSASAELSALDDLVSHWSLDSGELVAAEGWPYVSYTADASQAVSFAGATTTRQVDGVLVVTAGGTEYGIVAPSFDSFPTIDLERGEHVFVFALPGSGSIAELAAGAVPLISGAVTYATTGETVVTTYDLATDGGLPTLYGFRGGSGALSYDTLYGPVGLASGTKFVRSDAVVSERASLDLSAVGDTEALRDQVRLDTKATVFTATDTYGAGKQLYRAAMLYGLARDLGLDAEARALHDALVAQFDEWFDPAGCATRSDTCFDYDPVLGGIVGQQPSFGSDEFNDHHFHYGYFLSAVGILAADDPALVQRYRTVADLLALDIASPVDTDEFPRLRVFDAWAAHSWASGIAPFRDGNNQESVSEAVNAWNGLALWARASGNAQLLDEARWMLALETASATSLWLTPSMPEGFDAPFVAINWGGKRDYATFFDATPSAILGIELIPFSPATAFLPSTDRTRELVAGATGTPLADYVIMLQATVDPGSAAQAAASLPDAAIDGANSRSYLLAWISVQQATKR